MLVSLLYFKPICVKPSRQNIINALILVMFVCLFIHTHLCFLKLCLIGCYHLCFIVKKCDRNITIKYYDVNGHFSFCYIIQFVWLSVWHFKICLIGCCDPCFIVKQCAKPPGSTHMVNINKTRTIMTISSAATTRICPYVAKQWQAKIFFL